MACVENQDGFQRIEAGPLAAGLHRIRLFDNGSQVSGDYVIALDEVAPVASPNATPISDGQTVLGRIDSNGDQDLYEVRVRYAGAYATRRRVWWRWNWWRRRPPLRNHRSLRRMG